MGQPQAWRQERFTLQHPRQRRSSRTPCRSWNTFRDSTRQTGYSARLRHPSMANGTSSSILVNTLRFCYNSSSRQSRLGWGDFVKYLCKRYKGSGICVHKRRRSTCKQCKGRGICVHKRHRSTCKQCKGSGICIHNLAQLPSPGNAHVSNIDAHSLGQPLRKVLNANGHTVVGEPQTWRQERCLPCSTLASGVLLQRRVVLGVPGGIRLSGPGVPLRVYDTQAWQAKPRHQRWRVCSLP